MKKFHDGRGADAGNGCPKTISRAVREWFVSFLGNTLSLLQRENVKAIESWEQELEVMGAHTPIEYLEAHLSRAPGAGASYWYLRGYLAGARRH